MERRKCDALCPKIFVKFPAWFSVKDLNKSLGPCLIAVQLLLESAGETESVSVQQTFKDPGVGISSFSHQNEACPSDCGCWLRWRPYLGQLLRVTKAHEE